MKGNVTKFTFNGEIYANFNISIESTFTSLFKRSIKRNRSTEKI